MCRETSSLGTRPGPRFLGGALELVGLSWTEPIPGAPVLSVTLENVSSSELTGRAGCLVCFPISYGRTTAPGPGDADHPFEFSLERVAPRGRTVVQLPVDREEGMPLLAVWWR